MLEPPPLAPARQLVLQTFAQHLETPPHIPLPQWISEGNLILPREMSSEPGVMRLERTPYLRGILEAIEDPEVEEVVLQCGTQLGKSTVLLAIMAKVIVREPAPMLFVLPTIDVAKKVSRQRIAALIRANDALRDAVSESRSRDGGNTMLLKEFPGGVLVISGANSAASLSSMPMKWSLNDEYDDWPDDVDGQGDPAGLVIPRQDSFGSRARRAFVSSPKKPKGAIGIESRRLVGTNEFYEVPCPHCGEHQVLEWGTKTPHGIKWETRDGKPLLPTVAYACRHCRALIPESCKGTMLEGGQWIQTNPGSRVRSFHLSSLYSPLGWLSWRRMVQEFCAAIDAERRGNLEPLQTFTNTRLAETWELGGSTFNAKHLQESAEAFSLRFVPAQALVLLAAVDVQDDRFEIAVWGIGPHGAMWTVDTIVIVANPALEDSWKQVNQALHQRYEHEDGFELGIHAAAVDTGGHFTHEAYNFVRRCRKSRLIHAIKGADKAGMALVATASLVDVNWRGRILKGGVKLWHIGVNAAKDRLFGLMRAKDRHVHMSHELDESFFDQMTAEHKVAQKTARATRYVWVKRKGHARNEQLDCATYVVWLVERLKISSWTPTMWNALRKRLLEEARIHQATPPEVLGGEEAEVQTSALPAAPQQQPQPAPKRKGFVSRRPGFAKGWRS